MIREQDLREAIAECQGERNPNANTCIKLAAYYTILNNMIVTEEKSGYSFATAEPIRYDSGSEFCDAISGLDADVIIPIIDELMNVLSALAPRLYQATIKKLRET